MPKYRGTVYATITVSKDIVVEVEETEDSDDVKDTAHDLISEEAREQVRDLKGWSYEDDQDYEIQDIQLA